MLRYRALVAASPVVQALAKTTGISNSTVLSDSIDAILGNKVIETPDQTTVEPTFAAVCEQ